MPHVGVVPIAVEPLVHGPEAFAPALSLVGSLCVVWPPFPQAEYLVIVALLISFVSVVVQLPVGHPEIVIPQI